MRPQLLMGGSIYQVHPTIPTCTAHLRRIEKPENLEILKSVYTVVDFSNFIASQTDVYCKVLDLHNKQYRFHLMDHTFS